MPKHRQEPNRDKEVKQLNRLYYSVFMIIVVVIAILVYYNIYSLFSHPALPSPAPIRKPGVDGDVISTVLEYRIHDLVNQERNKSGLPPLSWNNGLRKVAYEHSADMSQNGFFSHFNYEGQAHDDRIIDAGIYYFSNSAENILEENIYIYDMDRIKGCTRTIIEKTSDQLAQEAVSGWMNSSGHRANILNDFDQSGVGAYLDANGATLYITQVFIKTADCGYMGGPCCGETLRYCFHPLECAQQNSTCFGKMSKLSPNQAPDPEADKFVPPPVCE